jgi:transposase InsO family protein
MASFTLTLDDDTLRKLTEAARRAGVTPDRMARMLVEAGLRAVDGLPGVPGVGEPARAWVGPGEDDGAEHPTTAESYEGPFVDLDEALDDFSAELNRRRRSSAG